MTMKAKLFVCLFVAAVATGCASTSSSEVNQLALADLTARTVGVDAKDVEISSIEVGRNYGIVPPPEVYSWVAKTSKGTYECETANGYNMTGGFTKGSGCTRIE
jgi:hypothetical protein